MKLSDALIRVWQQSLVDDAKAVQLEGRNIQSSGRLAIVSDKLILSSMIGTPWVGTKP